MFGRFQVEEESNKAWKARPDATFCSFLFLAHPPPYLKKKKKKK